MKNSKKIIKSRILLVIIVVIASFLAAFIGQILVTSLSKTPSLSPDESFIIRQTDVKEQMLQRTIGEILNNEQLGLVEIYQLSQGILKNVGNGLVLTNDGWIISSEQSQSIGNWNYIRSANGELLPIESIIEDPASDLVFLRVDSNELYPATIASTTAFSVLDEYVIAHYRGQMNIARVLNVIDKNYYLSSDQLNRFVYFSGGDKDDVVYDNSGEVAAYIIEKNEDYSIAIEVGYIRTILEKLLREDEITNTRLGIYYVDLSKRAVQEKYSLNNLKGALVGATQMPTDHEILPKTSSAYKGGIRYNDIIVSVEGRLVDEYNTLSDLIMNYKSGDEIEFGILRNNQPMSLNVILD